MPDQITIIIISRHPILRFLSSRADQTQHTTALFRVKLNMQPCISIFFVAILAWAVPALAAPAAAIPASQVSTTTEYPITSMLEKLQAIMPTATISSSEVSTTTTDPLVSMLATFMPGYKKPDSKRIGDHLDGLPEVHKQCFISESGKMYNISMDTDKDWFCGIGISFVKEWVFWHVDDCIAANSSEEYREATMHQARQWMVKTCGDTGW